MQKLPFFREARVRRASEVDSLREKRPALSGWMGRIPPENPAAKEARKGRSQRKTPRLSLGGTCGITV